MAGKTTNLYQVHRSIPDNDRTDLFSLASDSERTLFFNCKIQGDVQPHGLQLRWHLYCIPGAVLFRRTRLSVLEGVDGVVFVVNSRHGSLQNDQDALKELVIGLRAQQKDIRTFPIVMQYNKRDLPNAAPVPVLNRYLNPLGWPVVEASAVNDEGVQETFALIRSLVVANL